jgi:hypothetical protein
VTLGSLAQEPLAPASGYVAFFALGFFLGGLALLPRRVDAAGRAMAAGRAGGLRQID